MTFLQKILDIHFDPHGGTSYWLEREAQLKIDARRSITTTADLAIFGFMDVEA